MNSVQQHGHLGNAPARPLHAHHPQPAGHPLDGVSTVGSGEGGAHHSHHAHMVADFQRRFWAALF
jgi:hypothetical protein